MVLLMWRLWGGQGAKVRPGAGGHGCWGRRESSPPRLAPLQGTEVELSGSAGSDADAPFPLRLRSIAPLLARAIERLAADRPLGDLAAHG